MIQGVGESLCGSTAFSLGLLTAVVRLVIGDGNKVVHYGYMVRSHPRLVLRGHNGGCKARSLGCKRAVDE
jgi:hypothetical protein